MTMPQSGYVACGCRDCMEIAIGLTGALCHECADAGCDGEGECSVVPELTEGDR